MQLMKFKVKDRLVMLKQIFIKNIQRIVEGINLKIT